MSEQAGSPTASHFDASNLLIGYVVLVLLVPANLTIAALGAAGTPAGIYAMGLLLVWLLARTRGSLPRDLGALRWALAPIIGAYLLSYVAMSTRFSTSAETTSADRGVLRMLGWAGVVLITMDGLRTRRAMTRVLEAVAVCGSIVGLVGIIQYLTPYNPVTYIQIPGLSPNSDLAAGEIRSGFARALGTASHPIEFSVVMALMLTVVIPLATRSGLSRASRRRWVVVAAVTTVAVPLAVARSGFVALFVVMAVMIPSWPKAWRRRFYIGLPFGLVAGRLLFPGLLGTIVSLFQSTLSGSDDSTKGRTGDYAAVEAYFRDSPWIGRGFATFLPTTYRTLDNQLLGTLVETGIIGLTATVALVVTAIVVVRRARPKSAALDDRVLGQALIGWVAAGLATSATFDSLGFPMFAGVFFLGIGMCGAYAGTMRGNLTPSPMRRIHPGVRIAAACWVLILVAVGSSLVKSAPPQWTSTASMAIAPDPVPTLPNPYAQPVVTAQLTQIVYGIVNSDPSRERVRAVGDTARYEIAQGSGSLQMDTDVYDSGPILHVLAQSSNQVTTNRTINAAVDEIKRVLDQLQNEADVPASSRAFVTNLAITPTPVPLRGSHSRAYLTLVVLGVGGWLATGQLLQAYLDRRRRRRLGPAESGFEDPVDSDVTAEAKPSAVQLATR